MDWFEEWFDTHYYHILYKNRDDSEAHFFIDNLYKEFSITRDKTILDLACGKGRHAIYMAEKGNAVMGLDLSPNSISAAKQKIRNHPELSDRLRFEVADMRDFHLERQFSFIFNLFTSFGYFEDKDDNFKVIKCVSEHVDKNGIFLIDYLNSQKVKKTGTVKEHKLIDDIDFYTNKYIQDDFVFKEIKVVSGDETKFYRERVQLFESDEIQSMLEKNQFDVLAHYGDYALSPYSGDSPRSIFIAKAKN